MAGHFLPPCLSAVMTERLRERNPPPQGSEQEVQTPSQPLTTQSIAQDMRTHLRVSETAEQARPPDKPGVMMERERFLVAPSPQLLEQEENLVQPDILQSTGHETALQLALLMRLGHLRPPIRAAVTIDLVEVLRPPLHVLEHAPKRDQLDILQSMGQAKVLQVFIDVSIPHSLPPRGATTIDLVLFLVPLAQVAEQAENLDQLDRTQSTGQAKVLHAADALSVAQITPPFAGAVVTERDFTLKPLAQDLLHSP